MSATAPLEDSPSADLRLGLDWDGTVSCYAPELSLLARLAAQVVIVTLNDEITVDVASGKLGVGAGRILVCICPDDRIEDYGVWKAETCRAQSIHLMIDDDHTVTQACWAAGVPALLVVERPEVDGA